MSRMKLVTGIALLAFSGNGNATDEPHSPLTLPIPESPAASAIGAEGVPVLRPSSAREFASSLALLADRHGKMKPSLSFEVAPWLLFVGAKDVPGYASSVDPGKSETLKRTVWKTYGGFIPEFNWKWTAVNTALSIATGLKTSDTSDRADKVAIGLKVPWFDEGDPRIDLAFWNCYLDGVKAAEAEAKARADAAAPLRPGLPAAPINEKPRIAIPAATITLLETCRSRAQAANTFAKSGGFGFAQAWLDVGTDQEPRLHRAARIGWFSYTAMFGDAQNGRPWGLTAQAKVVNGDFDPNPAEGVTGLAIPRFNSKAFALRARGGRGDANFDLSASLEMRKYDDGRTSRVRIAALGYEFRVTEAMWLKLTMGAERGEKNDGTRAFVSTSISAARESEPSLCIFGKDSTNPAVCKVSP
jgi:hypothetical protein